MGMRELKSQGNFDSFSSCPFLKAFLDRFFIARIGIRVLAGRRYLFHLVVRVLMFLAAHHMALRESRDGYGMVRFFRIFFCHLMNLSCTAGVFKCKAVVRDIITEAIEEAEEMCFRCYGRFRSPTGLDVLMFFSDCTGSAPEVTVLGGVDLSLPYIPSHLHYWYSSACKTHVLFPHIVYAHVFLAFLSWYDCIIILLLLRGI